MYRLPTQFDASASRQDLAAAGGGSTSTTCSSCVVTLLGTSVLSAVVLGRLEPVAPAAHPGARDAQRQAQAAPLTVVCATVIGRILRARADGRDA